MSDQSDTAYLDEIRRGLRGHKRLAEGAFAQLRDAEFFQQLDSEANSVAILVQHIAGNLRSRFTDFLTSDGEKPDRHRDQEFIADTSLTRERLLQRWEEGWQCCFQAIDALHAEDLEKTVTIRRQPHTILQALNRAAMHMAYHVGQIVLLAKHIRGAQWKSLSVPRGKSEEFNAAMANKQKPSSFQPVLGKFIGRQTKTK
jgi:uncharacterized damage-inducible protein DinB